MVPRAARKPEFKDWNASDLVDLFGNQTRMLRNQLKSSDLFKDAASGS